MKPLAILTALLLAPLLPGQDVTPSPAPAADRERASSKLTDEKAHGGDSWDATPQLAAEVRQLEEILGNLRKLAGDDRLKYVAGRGLPEPEINSGVPKYLELKREFQKLVDQGLPPNHPRVVAKAKEIDALRKQLDQSVVALRELVQMKLELHNARYKKALAARLREQQQNEAIRKVEESQEYVDARRTYESEEDVLKVLELSLASTPNPKDPITAGLRTAVMEQQNRVAQARKAMASIMRERGIIHDGDDDETPPQPAHQSSPAANPATAKPK